MVKDTAGQPLAAAAMVRRLPPASAPVVSGSTPVVAFGDALAASVATLGINPSSVEFLGKRGLLSGGDRRLATLESLGAADLATLTDQQVAEVLADCDRYFLRRPYRRWFDPLDRLIHAGIGASYYDGSACHLDLVQWATDPIWGKIGDPSVRQALLDDGVPYLRQQLAHPNLRLVLLNGRSVLNQVRDVGLAALEADGEIAFGSHRCQLYVGRGNNVQWLGWSTNLQSSFGVTPAFKEDLAGWIRSTYSPGRDT